MEEWSEVEECEDLGSIDHVIYSGLVVLSTGQVVPTICLKEAGSPEYGGDCCWFVNGSWRQLGLDEVPDVQIVDSYTASPLACDRSFESDNGRYRAHHAIGFLRHAGRMSAEVTLKLVPRNLPNGHLAG